MDPPIPNLQVTEAMRVCLFVHAVHTCMHAYMHTTYNQYIQIYTTTIHVYIYM